MSFQDQYGRNSYGRVAPISSRNTTPQYDNNQLFSSPREYDNNIQAISNTIRNISTNVAQIRQLASQIGTSKDSVDVREKMRSLIESTKTMVKDTAQEFKALETNELYQQTLTQDERNKKRILQQKLMKDFQLTIQKFQEINKLSVEKEKANPLSNNKQGTQTGSRNSDPFAGLTIDEPVRNDYDLEAQRTKQFHVQNQLEFNEALIMDRDQGIREIEKTVVEVNEIFRDLSKLVIEQGQMIDNIESNIESSVQDTNRGVVEIRKASDYQKRSRTKLCILALILVIIVSVIVLVVWLMT